MRKNLKQPKIEHIYILSATQVSNIELMRGCSLRPLIIYEIDRKYESIEKLPTGQSVEFKITAKEAAKLIIENKAVCVKKDTTGQWVATDIYGGVLSDGMPIKQPRGGKAA